MNDANRATETNQRSDQASARNAAARFSDPDAEPGSAAANGRISHGDGASDAPATTRTDGASGSGERPARTSDLLQRDEGRRSAGPADGVEDQGTGEPPLLSDADDYLARWNTIQVGFVDQPSAAFWVSK